MNFTKSLCVKLAAGLLLLSTVAVPSFALSGTVNANGGLRLRSGAGTYAQIFTVLPDGTEVDVSGITESGWFRVSYNGKEGFVSGEYLVMDEDDIQDLEVVDEPVFGRVTEGPLNVRMEPTTDSGRVKMLSAGTLVQLTDTTLDGWYAVADGYVCADYIRIVDAAEAASVAASAPAFGNGAEVVSYAKQFLGCPYVYGGTSPRGFDCSGFAKYIYSNFGVYLNRTASAQMSNGVSISWGEMQPGDLVFFKKAGSSASRASHVGIYIGGGQFIHASTSRTGVIISDLSSAYYTSGFVGARRVI